MKQVSIIDWTILNARVDQEHETPSVVFDQKSRL